MFSASLHNALCPRCRLLRPSWLRAHRRHAGLSFHRVCCCCEADPCTDPSTCASDTPNPIACFGGYGNTNTPATITVTFSGVNFMSCKRSDSSSGSWWDFEWIHANPFNGPHVLMQEASNRWSVTYSDAVRRTQYSDSGACETVDGIYESGDVKIFLDILGFRRILVKQLTGAYRGLQYFVSEAVTTETGLFDCLCQTYDNIPAVEPEFFVTPHANATYGGTATGDPCS